MVTKNTKTMQPIMKKVTQFAQSVYDVTKQIPEGKITTYKLIAEAIRKPNACRAVGTALSTNPFAPTVPCHRVLPSNYAIGGFFGDKTIESKNVINKLELLKKEGIEFENNCVKKCAEYRKNITFIPEKL